MNEIRRWVIKNFADSTIEENSSLDKGMAYFNRHFERLILFCKLDVAKIDNNLTKQVLKLIVRNKKNAYFYNLILAPRFQTYLPH
jgi:hypothetical protein